MDSNGNPPLEEESQAAAAQVNADAWAIWNHTFNLVRSGELFRLCELVSWDGMRSIIPSGGCGGWTLVVRVKLDGYEEP
jgi:hypothetical protein